MQRLEVSGALRLIYKSLGVKGLTLKLKAHLATEQFLHLNLYAVHKYSFLVPEAAGSGSVYLLLTQHKSTYVIMAAKKKLYANMINIHLSSRK